MFFKASFEFGVHLIRTRQIHLSYDECTNFLARYKFTLKKISREKVFLAQGFKPTTFQLMYFNLSITFLRVICIFNQSLSPYWQPVIWVTLELSLKQLIRSPPTITQSQYIIQISRYLVQLLHSQP